MTDDDRVATGNLRYLGGPTALIDLGGVRLLTDPTFDPPGEYAVGQRTLVKLGEPAAAAAEIGAVDAVLLSHDQHPDNLDRGGRAYLASAPVVLSTPAAAERLGGAVRGLTSWESVDLPRPGGGSVRVTAVPAQHGPDGCEPYTGPVTGFVLAGDELPTVYVSGDNASLAVVTEIAARIGPVDVAVLFAGAAKTVLLDGAYLTLTSDAAAEAARVLGAPVVIPVHFEQWAHFSQGRDTLPGAFAAAGLEKVLRIPALGETITF
ncbi:MAG: MBL fold metallo-hydrolase [Hamadaea sp.]|nr:MBL fold metallo-hydrolase [Hamadaea sp.]